MAAGGQRILGSDVRGTPCPRIRCPGGQFLRGDRLSYYTGSAVTLVREDVWVEAKSGGACQLEAPVHMVVAANGGKLKGEEGGHMIRRHGTCMLTCTCHKLRR